MQTGEVKHNSGAQAAGLSCLAKIKNVAERSCRLDFLFSFILDVAEKVLEIKTAFFMLLDEHNGLLSIKAAKGLSDEAVRDLKIRLGQGVAGRVAKSGRAFMASSLCDEKRFLDSPEKAYALYQGKSLLSIPIRIKERVVGVITITRESRKGIFSRRDKELLMVLASYAAQAIEKNELYREIDYVMAKLQAIQSKYGRYEER